MRKTYKGKILKLDEHEIFVFGSNTEGLHGAGAARVACKLFGAHYGKAEGFQGQSYAIITKDLTKREQPSRTPEEIIAQIRKLYLDARKNPELQFKVAYSATGMNLNYYTPEQMAEMFKTADEEIPQNIEFEEGFHKLIFGD